MAERAVAALESDALCIARAVYALNFYSPIVADQLRSGRKTATIRLGDKSEKYKKGMIVQILCGSRYSPRERVFDAIIDKVEVKRLGELSRTRSSTTTRSSAPPTTWPSSSPGSTTATSLSTAR